MNDYSKVIVEQMDDLAVRSLPPEEFEAWSKVKEYYSKRVVTCSHTITRDCIENYGDHLNIVVDADEPNIQVYTDKHGNIVFACSI